MTQATLYDGLPDEQSTDFKNSTTGLNKTLAAETNKLTANGETKTEQKEVQLDLFEDTEVK